MGARQWIVIGAIVVVVLAIVLTVKPTTYDDQASWSVRQERSIGERPAAPSPDPAAPARSSGAGSGSDSVRGEGSVSTGTAK